MLQKLFLTYKVFRLLKCHIRFTHEKFKQQTIETAFFRKSDSKLGVSHETLALRRALTNSNAAIT